MVDTVSLSLFCGGFPLSLYFFLMAVPSSLFLRWFRSSFSLWWFSASTPLFFFLRRFHSPLFPIFFCGRNEQRHCGQLKNYVRIQNFRRSDGKNFPSSNKLNISIWSYDMECRAKKCVDRCYELSQNYSTTLKSQPLDDHQFKDEELKSVGELSTVFSHRWWL